jgi:YVTN family beta-propeller protein
LIIYCSDALVSILEVVMSLVRSRWAAVGAAVAVTLGAGGLVSVSADSGAQSVFTAVEPARVLDTRVAVGLAGVFQGGTARKLKVTGPVEVALAGGGTTTATVVPTGATAIVANLTAVRPTGQGYVAIRPGDATGIPSTSNLNVTPGGVFPNLVTVQLDTQGRVDLFYSRTGSSTDLLLDIVGYYLEGQGTPGPEGPPGSANRISDEQIAMLQWYQDPGRAATITVGAGPLGVASDGTNIWVANGGSGTVSKINPTTNTVIATVTDVDGARRVVFDGTNIWVTDGADSVSKIDPTTNTVTATIAVGAYPEHVAFDGTNIWVTSSRPSMVSKIDPTTNTVTATITDVDETGGMAFDGTNIWVTNPFLDTVSKIDPTTNTVTATITDVAYPGRVAFDGTNLWVTNGLSGTVSKINPNTNTVTATITVGDQPGGIAFDGTNIWVTNSGSDTVSKINPTTNTVTATIAVSAVPVGVAFDGTNIWVTNIGSDTVSKILPF